MLVGILSDSHGDGEAVRAALALLDQAGAEHLIFCGDLGDSEVFDQLAGRPCDFVWGNCDYPDPNLQTYVKTIGLSLPGPPPLLLTLGGKTFAVFHGHESSFNAAIENPSVDYILHGHSHLKRDERRRQCRIINPGALYRAAIKTVATLDTETDTLTFHVVPGI